MIQIAARGRVLHIELNRPEKRNALNLETCRALCDALDRADADSGVGAVLLSGRGAAFCSGMDLSEVLAADQHALADVHERLFTTVYRARKPIVAAVHGVALAAGVGLAANSHFVVAAPDARFGITEIRIGLWPVLIFRSVVSAIGERRATELSMSGRMFSAQEAADWSLVTEIHTEPAARAFELATSLAACSPEASAAGLEYINRTRLLGWREAGAVAREVRGALMEKADFTEGVQAFLEKRAAVWPSLKSAPKG